MATLGELAELVGGRLHGPAETPICGADIIRDVGIGQITLATGPQLAEELAASAAAAVVVPDGFEPTDIPYISVDDVHTGFAKIVQSFRPPQRVPAPGVRPGAHVDPKAELAADATVHAGATIGEDVQVGPRCVIHSGVQLLPGCKIGADVTIFPNAVLYENTVVGDRVIIHANAVLGSYGFGYRTVDGTHQLTAQLGWVELENDVEIGAGTTVDRATYGCTKIGAGTKIDNQVQIGHNCRIGQHNLLCGHVGIAGSCTTGDYVVMAGQVGLRDHIHIGDRSVLGAKSGIMGDVPSDAVYIGIPATPDKEQMVKQVALSKLPELRKEIKSLVRRVFALEEDPRREAA